MVLSMERWIGKVAVVTGASTGIGAAVSEALIKEGIHVVGLARRVELLNELSKTISTESTKFHPHGVDLRDETSILAAFKWIETNLGPVHILINNAGVVASTDLSNGNTDDWRAVLETNVLALSIATREALRIMKTNRIDGQVIHINSILGHYVPFMPGASMYPASKHAVSALTEILRQELIKSGTKIRISSISPGPVDTDMIKSLEKRERISLPKLFGSDVADSVIYVLSTPPHVQIQDILIRPLGEPY